MLWLIFQFYKKNFQIFLIKKNSKNDWKIFSNFFFQKSLTKVNEKTLIK